MSDEDRIEKVIDLDAPLPRVWLALTDHKQFGQWFRVNLDGPFVVGTVSTGTMRYPGYEHLPWRARIERMESQRLFAFRWHDFDEKSGIDIAQQPTTLVEFRLQAIPTGTRLTIIESGFSALSDPRRLEVMRDNTQGWAIQADNLAGHVTAAP